MKKSDFIICKVKTDQHNPLGVITYLIPPCNIKCLKGMSGNTFEVELKNPSDITIRQGEKLETTLEN